MSILRRWKNKEKGKLANDIIGKVPYGATIPLTGGQQRLFFLESLYPKNPVYNSSEIYTFRGRLVIENLKKSLQTIFDLNEVFRCSFHFKDGVPFQNVEDSVKVNLVQYDISDLLASEKDLRIEEIMSSDALNPFDLNNPPLIRTTLIKRHSNEHILFITMHHIIVDKWSMGLLREQLAKYYRSLPSNSEIFEIQSRIQFPDFAYWQQSRDSDKNQLEYWKNKLSGKIPKLELPIDYPHPAHPTFKGDSNVQLLSKSLSNKILELSKEAECTPFILLLSVYYVLLFRYSRQNDIVIGSPISIRNSKTLENVIGFFDETIVLRTDFSLPISFLDLVKLVRQTVLEAFSNKDISFDVLVREVKPERVAGINPFLRTMFIYHDVLPMPFFGEDLELSYDFYNTGVSKFDLTLYVANENGQLLTEFEYSTDLFDETTIEQLQDHFRLVLIGVTDNPKFDISAIPMMTEREKEILLPEKATCPGPFDSYKSIHEIIRHSASDKKDAIALVYGPEHLTYGELDDLSDTIAQHILAYSNNDRQIIGLCMERSTTLIAGLLGILKAGCAYLPLDPDYPLGRISFMLEDSKVPIVLTQANLSSKFNSFKGTQLLINEIINSNESHSIAFPDVKSFDLAYVIYTSGSTGKPKGVPITHSNIINSTEGRLSFYPENPTAFLLMSSVAFDSSKAGIFWTLCTGGTLVISEKRLEQDVAKMNDIINDKKISHTLMLPSLYKVLLEYSDLSKLESLTTVMVAGEACSAALCTTHFSKLPNVGLYNEYGPTEASVWCMAYRITNENLGYITPIGSAVANAEIYLLDSNLNLVPFGAVGEIYVGGPGLANTYLNRPDLTDLAYINNPFSEVVGDKLYKTGDLGRYRNDGEMLFLGRADQQVKIRGFRVELNEIEEVIRKNPTVDKALVVVSESNKSDAASGADNAGYLIAYVECQENLDIEQLKKELAISLPNYMVPSVIIPIDNFPLLPNGKIDRKSLPKPEKNNVTTLSSKFQGPRNELEIALTEIWQEVLNMTPIGVYDNFFEIGGDSILSIQIVAKARSKNIMLKANQIFENQTIADLALFSNIGTLDIIEEQSVEGNVSLTPIQHWFFNTHQNAPHYWNQMVRLLNVGKLDWSIIQLAIEELVYYHDALRLKFVKTEYWKAIVNSKDEIKVFRLEDVSFISDTGEQDIKIQELLVAVQESAKLSDGQLFKCIYFNCGETQENQVFLIAHHLVIDVVSWNILFNDLNVAINQIQDNKPLLFTGKTASIEKWGEYLKELSKSKHLKEELSFWKSQKNDIQMFPSDFVCEKNYYKESTIEINQASLGSEDTLKLQKDANWVYNTKIEELLVTALLSVLHEWSHLDRICLGMEKHGRSAEILDLDVSGTIGWFTSYFPVALNVIKQRDIGDQIKSVKEQLRKVPNNGVGYGILKYLNQEQINIEELDQQPQVIFNYLGNRMVNENTSNIGYDLLWEGSRDSRSERSYGLEINAYILNGQLYSNWSYSTDLYKTTTIEKLVSEYNAVLHQIILHCKNKEVREYTPSDFPEADISQDDLDNLLENL
ncbi:amino acid adenylation domain-containing protein [Arenibacter sp. BSSL-BM3]|uniref:Amino acid adenylation domain-containing protein n=1 Tax=Arenibacter arenosicollis TaxID=2762274 RepID=A0ABR7QRV3_9FLAO|nr:non-ribosomal peptide synthetase [Arenibacter arenosicollis]MBC8769911.1 amino acid adenylation domain-containing protein [Arenibacter arenosicollis]